MCQKWCVVGLGDAYENESNNDSPIDELARVMDRRANDLENTHPLPTIQFAVEGSFHHHSDTYDLHYGDEFYSLQRVFGPQLDREESGWLVAPF